MRNKAPFSLVCAGVFCLVAACFIATGYWSSSAARLNTPLFAVTVDFRQAANNETNGPVTGLGNVHWIGSILQQNNSKYYENMSVPQRTLLTGLSGATHTFVFSHLATKGGHHGYDFLTSYDQAVTTAAQNGITLNLNPCGREIGPPNSLGATCNALRNPPFGQPVYYYDVAIPDDPFISKDGPTQTRLDAYEAAYGNRTIRLYSNKPFSTLSPPQLMLSHDVANGGDTADSAITYTLTWRTTSASDLVLIEMAGHLAVCDEIPGIGWGAGLGAAQIGGGAYHFRLHTIDGAQLGSGDNQIKTNDILQFPPTCAITGPDAVCAATSNVTFAANAAAGVTHQWAITAGDATFCSGTTGQTVCVNVGNTNFTLQLTETGGGGSTPCSKTVTVNPRPVVTTTGGQLGCGTMGIQIGATSSLSNSTFSWTGPGIVSGGNTATPVVNAAGTYTVTVTSPSMCSTTATALVMANTSAPDVSAQANGVLTCTVTQTSVTASSLTPNVSFSWSGPGIVGSNTGPTVQVNQPGTYTVTATNPANNCTNTAQVTVTRNNTPPNVTATAGAPLTCTTLQTTVSANSTTTGATFSWTGPGIVGANTGATIQVNLPGVYTVTATDPNNGCTNTAQTTVTETADRPNVSATAGAPLTCTTLQTTVTASSTTTGATFSWSGPGIVGSNTGPTIQVNQPGTYIVTATNPANGCTNTAQAVVTRNGTPPNVIATAGAPLTCTTLQTTVSASSTTPGATFSWTGPGLMGATPGATITVTQPGAYTVTATDPSNGCTNTAQAVVTQNSTPPNVTAIAGAPLSCTTTQTNVLASSTTTGVTFSWTGPGIVGVNTGAVIQVNQPGTYTVTATDPNNGCTNTAQATVTENADRPNVSAAAGASLSCSVRQTTVSASSTTMGATFSWTGPGIVGANTGATIQVNRPGVYVVTATAPNGCTNTAQATVTEDLSPPTVSAGPDQAQCSTSGTTVFTLAGSVNRGTPLWSVVSGPVVIANPNSLTSTATFTGVGVATLKLTATDGVCIAEDTVVLSAGSLSVSVTTTESCEVPVVLTANVAGGVAPYTYSWTGPGGFTANTQTITATTPGPYTVTVTDAQGCTGSKTYVACASVVSDQKAGSILFYNLFSSNAASPDLEDTRINITNTNATTPIAVHLFFVDGSTCSVANRTICLTPNQTASFLASSLDPGITGYLIAVAVDRQTGCPINFNYLIGDEYIKLASGHKANLAAESLRARFGTPGARLPGCDGTSVSAVLPLDGVTYDAVPRVLSWNNIPSVAPSPTTGQPANQPLLIVNRVGGDLQTGAAPVDALFGLLFDDLERGYSFSIYGGCQIKQRLNDYFPRTVPRLTTVIPFGRTGWLKFWPTTDYGIFGAGINFSPNASTSIRNYNQGHNLHKHTLTTQSFYVMPIVPPRC